MLTDTLTILPGKLCGSICAMPSKSMTHRALILARLGGGTVTNPNISDDTDATRRSLCAIFDSTTPDAQNSAATLRLLLPFAIMQKKPAFLMGSGLYSRPLYALEECLKNTHASHIEKADGMLRLFGELRPGVFEIDGFLSSQFISGLLLALPLLDGDSEIKLKSPLVSKPYVDMTIAMQRMCNVNCENSLEETAQGYIVRGRQRYMPANFTIEGDYTHAANFLVLNALGENVCVTGLCSPSLQGDSKITELLDSDCVDVTNVPDLFPALAVLACKRQNVTRFIGTGRLKYKECDRPAAMAAELFKLGAKTELGENSFTVYGSGALHGGEVDSHGDHRIAMALTVAASLCDEAVVLHGCRCVSKSAPGFFDEYRAIGGKIL